MKNWDALCPGCFEYIEGSGPCTHCGYDESAEISPLVIPYKTILNGQYLIGKVLGRPGGFGITYLAMEMNLEKLVAIKEYLPRDFVSRETGKTTVIPHSKEDKDEFEYGLKQFIEETRILAKFSHSSIARVLNFFQENGTAYMVMEYYQGQDLSGYLQAQGGKISEEEALWIFQPLLLGLGEIHKLGYLHRDIKPANIYITSMGTPILLDFGAARQVFGERSKSVSILFTPGFAPPEQYARRGNYGPWTDLFSCAAVLYYLVSGDLPADSMDRLQGAEINPLHNVSEQFKTAVMKALEIDINKRPSSVNEFYESLYGKGKHEESGDLSVIQMNMEMDASGTPVLTKPINCDDESISPRGKSKDVSGKESIKQLPMAQKNSTGKKQKQVFIAACLTALLIFGGVYSYHRLYKKPTTAQSNKPVNIASNSIPAKGSVPASSINAQESNTPNSPDNTPTQKQPNTGSNNDNNNDDNKSITDIPAVNNINNTPEVVSPPGQSNQTNTIKNETVNTRPQTADLPLIKVNVSGNTSTAIIISLKPGGTWLTVPDSICGCDWFPVGQDTIKMDFINIPTVDDDNKLTYDTVNVEGGSVYFEKGVPDNFYSVTTKKLKWLEH